MIYYNMNNIIKILEISEYEIDDYKKIINLCNDKIYSIENKELNFIFLNNVKKIKLINEELQFFFDIIYNTLKLNIDHHLSYISISFDYKEYLIDLIIYSDDDDFNSVFMNEKIHINNKKTHKFETYYNNCDQILLKTLNLISINFTELNIFIKELFECVPIKRL